MNLEPLRAALRAEADAEAEQRRDEVEEEGTRRLAEARVRADAIVEQARRDGVQEAERQARRWRASARRRARELRLEAERSLVDELRLRAYDAALELRTDPRYPELLERLSDAARSQLGTDVRLEVDPPEVGGVVARAGSMSVDYSLPALVDRAIVDLDGELEGLWR